VLGASGADETRRYGIANGANVFASSVASGFEGLAVSSFCLKCGFTLTKLPLAQTPRGSRGGRCWWFLQGRWQGESGRYVGDADTDYYDLLRDLSG
jgi:hypothetical protein